MDQQGLQKILRLAKRYLLPSVKKWWKKRQNQPHQNQQQQQPVQQQAPYQQQQQYQQKPQHQQSYAQASQQQNQQFYGGQYGPPPSQPYHQQQGPPPGSYAAPQHHQQQQQNHYVPPAGNHDMQNASNPHYVSLRNQAIQEGNLMHQAFDAASRAHDAGDGAEAKRLSNEGHAHQRKREQINDEAADWIFNANNSVQPPGSIDLHGLYVQEAIERVERAVKDAQSRNMSELRVITGKGIHSTNHTAKIKPAIENLMVKYNLAAHLDPHNSGVLVVNLAGGGSRDLGWVDQADREAGDGQCVIM